MNMTDPILELRQALARLMTPAQVIWAASACSVMGGAAIAPALPKIEAALLGTEFGATDTAGFWGRVALILPAVVVMLAGPWVGRWCARLHQGRGLVLSLVAVALSGGAGALATEIGSLLLTRLVLGLATAVSLCFATAAIAQQFSGVARTRVIGRQSAINTFGGAVFALGGGALAVWGWQMPFLVYLLALPVALAAAGQDWGAKATDQSSRTAPVPVDWLPLLVLGGMMMGFYLIPAHAPYVPVLSAAPSQAGLVVATGTIVSGLASLAVAKRLPSEHRRLVQLAGGLMALGLVEMALAQSLAALVLAAALMGAGFGIVLPLTVRQMMDRVDSDAAHALSARIAAALFAGQVGATALAVASAVLHPAAPFTLMSAVTSMALILSARSTHKTARRAL
jgi:MFS family permease